MCVCEQDITVLSSNFSEKTSDLNKSTLAVSLSLADGVKIGSRLHLVLTPNLYLDTEKHMLTQV